MLLYSDHTHLLGARVVLRLNQICRVYLCFIELFNSDTDLNPS